jgi:hypothetical protein
MDRDDEHKVPDEQHGTTMPDDPDTPTGSGDPEEDEEHEPSPSPGRSIGGGTGRSSQ